MWNNVNLSAPHGDFCVYPADESHILGTLSNVAEILIQSADVIGPDHSIWREIKVIECLKKRISLKLPCDKFLHLFQRLLHCLKTLLKMDLVNEYLSLAQIFLKSMGTCKDSSESVPMQQRHVPSQQQLQYLLLRIQGASKLVHQMINYSEEAFLSVIQQLSVGHMTRYLVMVAAALARSRYSLKAFLVQLCDSYCALKPYCEKLKAGSWTWFSSLDLPEDLWTWLSPDETSKACDDILSEKKLQFLKTMFESDNQKLGDEFSTADTFFTMPSSSAHEDMGIAQERTAAETGEPLHFLSKNSDSKKPEGRSAQFTKEYLKILEMIKDAKSILSLVKIHRSILRENIGIFSEHLSLENVSQLESCFHYLKQCGRDMKDMEGNSVKRYRKTVIKKVKLCLKSNFCERLKPETFDTISTDAPISNIENQVPKCVTTPKKLKRFYQKLVSRVTDPKLFVELTEKYLTCADNVKHLKESGNPELVGKLVLKTCKEMLRQFKII